MDELKCQDCGTTENVRETTCPFAKEIHEKEIHVVLCACCYQERLWDI